LYSELSEKLKSCILDLSPIRGLMRTSSKNPKLEYRNTKQTKKLKFELRIPKSETGAKRIPKSLNEFASHFVFLVI
jgi:hypothetical protein